MMRKLIASVLAGALLAGGAVSAPAVAQKHSDQDSARKETRAGRVLTLRELERPQVAVDPECAICTDGAAKTHRSRRTGVHR